MVKITEIKKLKRLYKVTLADFVVLEKDEDPVDTLYVTEDTIVKFMLGKERDYSEAELREVAAFAAYSRGKNAAIYYLSFKARTASEVAKYLQEQEVPEGNIGRILSELEELGLIDDRAYAERAVESAVLAAKSGPYKISQKLMQRGVAKDVIQKALSNGFPEKLQLQIAVKTGEKKAAAIAHRTPAKLLRQKVQQTLVSAGFSYGVTNEAMDAIAFEKDEENEADLLAQEAEKVYGRLSRRYEGYDLKQHVMQALARKGFDWGDIDDTLGGYEF
ncbi:MAG: recombination regulator RecX [Streptococcaceae bacterium]|jgi:regulatory protein|nr:recombination regulator RecX [Streptococcaceae bacterium]